MFTQLFYKKGLELHPPRIYASPPDKSTLHMETSQVEVESQAIELATQAFKAFCGEISGMFGVDMECQRRDIAAETMEGLKKRFKKPVAVNIVDSEGTLGGTFLFVFDQEGLFTLGGIATMQSEEMILANRNNASPELAGTMVNAMCEAGNLLVASWDRVFREGLDGHSRFMHRLPALVGSPWDQSKETMGLTGDQELVFVPYQMTIGSYPAFDCGVIFPKTIFRENSEFVPEQAADVGQNNQDVIEETSQELAGENTQEPTEENAQEVTEENNQKPTEENPQEIAEENIPETTEENPQQATEENTQKPTGESAQEVTEENTREPTEENPQEVIEENVQEVTEENTQEPTEESPQEVTGENAQDIQDAGEATDSGEFDTVQSSDGQESTPQETAAADMPAEQTDTGENPEQTPAEQPPQNSTDSQQEPAVQESVAEQPTPQEPEPSPARQDAAPAPDAADSPAEATPAVSETSEELATGKVSEAIQKITKSPAVLPGGSGHPAMTTNIAFSDGEYLKICAKDIMQKNILRAAPDESLQQALAKMRQTDAGYIVVEQNGVLEGIVSKSDITGAMSPYLQPIFSKWRRPLDDATLKIRIKWVMSRPVRTIKPETPLAAIVEHMSHFRGRCLAVTDDAGKVQGLVTAFDIFDALLNGPPDASTDDAAPEIPAEPAALTETT